MSDERGGPVAQPATAADAASRARARARLTARAVTLGLALGAGAPGCEASADLYCDVFTGTRFCCERTGYSMWDETSHTCVVRAVPGPIVAPPS